MWEQWKKSFEAWESHTAEALEQLMKSPLVLAPAGHLLTAVLKLKGSSDRWLQGGWSALGLPTRRDQERTLHALNQLQSRLLDLEEQLLSQRSPLQPSTHGLQRPAMPAARARGRR